MVDIAASEGWLATALRVMLLVQMCVQGRWLSESSLLCLPHLEPSHLSLLSETALKRSKAARQSGLQELDCLAEMLVVVAREPAFLHHALEKTHSYQQISQV